MMRRRNRLVRTRRRQWRKTISNLGGHAEHPEAAGEFVDGMCHRLGRLVLLGNPSVGAALGIVEPCDAKD